MAQDLLYRISKRKPTEEKVENRAIHGNKEDGQTVTKNERLRKAIAERDRYLAEHPQLASYQTEIDTVLDKSGNQEGRMAVLGTLLQGKMLEMQNELKKLVTLANKT